jgi:SOS response regulatory protein OraA/RecX
MKITEIGIRRRHLAAISLYPAPEKIEGADYEKDKILIDREILSRCKIVKDTELSLEDLKQLVHVSECYRAKNRAIWYLSKNDISEKALFEKLTKNFSEKASAFAVEQMVKRGYVDDRRYAENMVRLLNAKNISGRGAITKMLSKGIPLETAKDVLEGYKDDDVIRACNLLKTKYKNKLTEEDLNKTIAALSRRGFSYQTIKSAIESILNPQD